ncbi:MAG: S8 family peptidase [Candidatus Yanofskybacteria bacterium]|nr:S8 family peptidase [Candidatus Yanofskybacteria bacterium]
MTIETKKVAYLLVFSLVLGFSGFAYGASDDTRYLVKSNSNFWKKSFGVRHQFEEGFTTDLTDWQIRVARVFGVELIPVKKLYVLPESPVVPDPADTDTKAKSARPSPARLLPSDQIPWGVEAVYGGKLLTDKPSGGAGVSVAVLDTGILRAHPDLKSRIKECKDFTSAKQSVVDNSCDDKNGHGTHVAGTIAADGGSDSKGIYGVAPESDLLVYKVCGANGSCWSDDIAVAMRTAAVNGANIINMSLGSDSESSLIRDAISYAVEKNVLVVAASGNDGPDIGSIDYPGANPDVIAVGAFDIDRDVADWSSRGSNSTTDPNSINYGDIEFAAPGVVVESTGKDGGYVIMSGTSMATPHIAGLAAKEWQKDAPDPDSATRDLLYKFSQDLGYVGEDDASGFGFPHL